LKIGSERVGAADLIPFHSSKSDTLRISMIVPAATRHRKVTKADQPIFIVEVAKMTQRLLQT
jgi:hypothetical protein